MKLSILTSLITILSSAALSSQTTFQKIMSSTSASSDVAGNSLGTTQDGGFVICGHTNDYSNGAEYDIYLIRTNLVGDTLWSRQYGNVAGDESGYCVNQTYDGGFIITGYSTSFGSGYSDVYLLKTDSSGTLQWSKAFGGSNEEYGYSVAQCADSGFIVSGWTNSFGAGNADVLVWKTDKLGNTQWSTTLGGSSYDFGLSVTQTNDCGYVLTGQTASFGDTLGDLFLIKMDSIGNLEWSYLYGQNGYWETGNSVRQTMDRGFIIVGGSRMFPNIDSDVYLIKTDSSGNYQWSKTFGGTDYDMGNDVIQTTDGGYAIIGNTMSFGFGHTDAYVIKTDSTGNVQWSKAYGGAWYDNGNSMIQHTDGSFVITGYAQISPGGVYIIKTDSQGNSGCNETIPMTVQNTIATSQLNFSPIALTPIIIPLVALTTTTFPNSVDTTICFSVGVNEIIGTAPITLFPNPATFSLTIQNVCNCESYLVSDLTGNLIQSGNIAGENFTIDVSSLSTGIYFLQLTSELANATTRFVKIE